jgi:hypothetical protein
LLPSGVEIVPELAGSQGVRSRLDFQQRRPCALSARDSYKSVRIEALIPEVEGTSMNVDNVPAGAPSG